MCYCLRLYDLSKKVKFIYSVVTKFYEICISLPYFFSLLSRIYEIFEFAMMKKLREQWQESNKNRQIKSDSFPFFIYFFLSIIAGLTLINERSHHTVEVVCFFIFLSEVWGPNEAKRGHVRSYFFMWLRLTIACRCK